MAFTNVEDRDLCKKLIADGEKAKDIVEALGGRCTVTDVYGLRNFLKKKQGTGGENKKPKKPPTASDMPPFIAALVEERDRLEARVKTLNELIDLYESDIPLDLHKDMGK